MGAVALGQPFVGVVVALMYSGGNVLEDFAVARAEQNLRALVDRAPRVAHCYTNGRIEDVPVGEMVISDRALVRSGEVVPVDGVLVVDSAMIDESPLIGEPIPAPRSKGASICSGSVKQVMHSR